MAQTFSVMEELGKPMPDFLLKDPRTNQMVSREALTNDLCVIMFICNHCPYVVHIRPKLVEVAQAFQKQGVDFIGINSNDPTQYPEDGPQHMGKMNLPFPYLFDEAQDVARAFGAVCTPDFFLYHKRRLVYRGRFDGSTPGNGVPLTGSDLSQALNELLEHQKTWIEQKPSLGCSIKWRPGDIREAVPLSASQTPAQAKSLPRVHPE
jgi:peroxiredoxin